MPPKRLTVDRELVLSVAHEVAATEESPSRTKLASRLGMVQSTLSNILRREGWVDAVDAILHPPVDARSAAAGVAENDDGSVTFATDVANQPPAPWKPEEVMRAHGRDPDDYIILRERFNRWGTPDAPSHQLRFDAIPKASLIRPPDPQDWEPPPKPKVRKASLDSPRKVVICGDHHAPLHDRTLHALFLEWLADERPDEGVILGDLMDFSSISRHRRGKRIPPATVNECLEAAFGILMDYRHASPDTRWTLLPGNHDDRLDHIQLDNVPDIYEVKAAGDGVAALSLRRLLHLDDLGVELVTDDFNRAKHLLGRKLVLRHGYLTSKNAADQMLQKLSRSAVQGHSHRMRMVWKTAHDEGNEEEPTTTRLAVEAGCMAEIHEGLHYQDEPDWHQGFMAAYLWPDDDFHLAPVPYVPGRLLTPSGKRYEAD